MTPYPLSKSDKSTKILITLFLATMAVSVGVAELNVKDKVDWTAAGVVRRYGPEEDVGPPASLSSPDEPGATEDEFPPESGTTELAVPKAEPTLVEGEPLVARMNTFSLLLDVTHPHVFELPLVVFVLAHFLMRTRAPNWFKLTNYFVGFAGVVAFLGSPWVVRYLSIRAAPMLLVGAVMIGLACASMVVVPIWDMWTPHRRKRAASRAGRAAGDVTPAGAES
jgi:hypothetical protein